MIFTEQPDTHTTTNGVASSETFVHGLSNQSIPNWIAHGKHKQKTTPKSGWWTRTLRSAPKFLGFRQLEHFYYILSADFVPAFAEECNEDIVDKTFRCFALVRVDDCRVNDVVDFVDHMADVFLSNYKAGVGN